MADINYIIVQAGGKGTRLKHLTKNKPKALLPLNGKPMIFYLFDKFPDKHFIIISDYKKDVLIKYLNCFARVKYTVVDTGGKTGTCSGIRTALDEIPVNTSFLLIWSDLVLPDLFFLPEGGANYLGISEGFNCRWRYHNKNFEEIPSLTEGIAGFFIFTDKYKIKDVSIDGEFVRWLKFQDIHWNVLNLSGVKEYGELLEYERAMKFKIGSHCRPFNKIEIVKDKVIKLGTNDQGKKLAALETSWYEYVQQHDFTYIPKIFSYDPIIMERINGKNIFEYNFSFRSKRKILENIINSLKELHSINTIEPDKDSIIEAYYDKTISRIDSVKNIIPFSDREYIIINNTKCRNVFFSYEKFSNIISNYKCKEFCIIHGDNTFSNIMLKNDEYPIFIDPRGYFGKTKLFGDPNYDWAKLYYSIVGNYDQFNIRNFILDIGTDEVSIFINSNNWEQLENEFFTLIGDHVVKNDIKLIHGIIWLSLTTYAWDDYDSICGAFYNGLWYLRDII